ncbi:hypothetical protein FYJ43_11475 [Cutibacterium sp. WCA-380-WT-3A]|uniref:DUF4381 domain-containing protein n=1 Tax=Cutibacterium porci TaxID=2605781 RepID=A0A7K0JA39_9ACTN|nr:hypothetical protein [Cutibacterium porci]MSS46618.1 hypothetical protein [Cutibacterium porci]
MHVETSPHYGPLLHSPWWWAFAVGLVIIGVAGLAAIIVGGIKNWLNRRRLTTLGGQRRIATRRLDNAEADWKAGRLNSDELYSHVSATLRRFVGLAEDDDADFRSVEWLRERATTDDRFVEIADIVSDCVAGRFGGGTTADPRDVVARARQVVATWL